MKYYIKLNEQWQEVQVEIEPKYVKAFDTTNDTLSCILKANDVKDAYKPMTPFKIEETVGNNTETTILWIINDTVDIFSLKPLKYKHSLTIVQYRYFLNKHLIRNTVFNQPRKTKLQLYGAISSMRLMESDSEFFLPIWCFIPKMFSHNGGSSTPLWVSGVNFWGDKLALNNHSKIKNFDFIKT